MKQILLSPEAQMYVSAGTRVEHSVAMQPNQVHIQNGPTVSSDRLDQYQSMGQNLYDELMPSKLMHPKSTIARSLHHGGQMADGNGNELSEDSPSSSDSLDSSDSDPSSSPEENGGSGRKRK